MPLKIRVLLIFLSALLLTSCKKQPPKDETPPQLALKSADFTDLPGWENDQITQIAPAFTKSCTRILKRDATAAFGALEESGTYGDWQPLCTRFLALDHGDEAALRAFFTENFTPHQVVARYGEKDTQEAQSGATGKSKQEASRPVRPNGKNKNKASQAESPNGKIIDKPTGLFTGYYEAALKGSRTKSGPYIYPLYTRPDDLIMVQLGDFREDLKGRRIAGRVVGGNLKPYENRAQIVAGDWPHNDKVLVWVDNAVDAFFVQIQGSGVVELNDGTTMRIGYAGQNGHPYYAIGRELIKRGYLTKDTVSMQTIREWLTLNPYEADEIMNTNASYVFFRELKGEGPIGGEGVALTAGRSLAIDRSLLSYGLPIWLSLSAPKEVEDVNSHIEPDWNHLMIAQDTGGAIRGPVRGDIFWGYGERAEYYAGHMKREGQYWVLLPKGIGAEEQ